MKFALINPNWNFDGSTYFGCQDPHYPLELMFAFDQIQATGDEALLDAYSSYLRVQEQALELSVSSIAKWQCAVSLITLSRSLRTSPGPKL